MMQAAKHASVSTRSVSMQIEHWARIGKTADENPDLPYAFIEDALTTSKPPPPPRQRQRTRWGAF